MTRRMWTTRLSGCAMYRGLLVAAVAGVAAVALGMLIWFLPPSPRPISGAQPSPTSERPTTGIMARPVPTDASRPAFPHLTVDDEARALAIALDDPRLRRILEGRAYTVTDIGVWHASRDLRKIGAVIRIALAERATIEADWPWADYDDSETMWPPYIERIEHSRIDDVSGLWALVDLTINRLVGIDPVPH
jgi:hypothetical protein